LFKFIKTEQRDGVAYDLWNTITGKLAHLLTNLMRSVCFFLFYIITNQGGDHFNETFIFVLNLRGIVLYIHMHEACMFGYLTMYLYMHIILICLLHLNTNTNIHVIASSVRVVLGILKSKNIVTNCYANTLTLVPKIHKIRSYINT
jgi:hypothetical protein